MKKYVLLVGSILLCGGLFAATQGEKVVAVKAEIDSTPNFDDDFENYTSFETSNEAILNAQTIKTEMGTKWTNCWFEGNDNEGYNSPEHFYVVDNPVKTGNTSNKALLLDGLNLSNISASNNVWDFYLNPLDYVNHKSAYKVQNYDLEYDFMYYDIATDAYGWHGAHLKKDCNKRFDQATGLLAILAPSECGNNYLAKDEMPSNGKTLPQFSTTVYGTVTTVPADFKDEPFDEASQTWYHAKFSVNTFMNEETQKLNTKFDIYINDTLVGSYTHTKGKALHDYGQVSLNMNNCKVYIDNFHVENKDTEPWVDPDDIIPVMGATSYSYVRGSNLVVTADLKGQEFVSLKNGAYTLTESDFSRDGGTFTIFDSYLSTLKVGTRSFSLTTSGGAVSFGVTIPKVEEEGEGGEGGGQEENPPTPPAPADKDEESSKGCGGSIIAASSLVTLLSLTGVALLKNKKHD